MKEKDFKSMIYSLNIDKDKEKRITLHHDSILLTNNARREKTRSQHSMISL